MYCIINNITNFTPVLDTVTTGGEGKLWEYVDIHQAIPTLFPFAKFFEKCQKKKYEGEKKKKKKN